MYLIAPATIMFIGAEMHIDPALLSAISALVGALMGGGASPAAAICTNATKAQSGGGQGVELTSAFGRAAEVHGSTASLPSTYVAMPEVSHALRHKTPQLQSAN